MLNMLCCYLVELQPSEGVSLFSTVMLFHLAHSQKAEDLSPEVAIPETFFVPKYGLYSKG